MDTNDFWEQLKSQWEGSPVVVLDASHVSIRWHSHTFYELVFVKEGYCLHHLGDSVFLAMEGDILLIKPGVRHRYTGTRECKIYNCLFTQEAFTDESSAQLQQLSGIPQLLSASAYEFPHMHLSMVERKGVQEILSQIGKEYEKRCQGWKLKVRYLFWCLMVECSRAYAERGSEQAEEECYTGYVTKALRYIDEHFTDPGLTVQELGEFVGVSGDYLSRQFKKITGIAAQEYIRRYRLSRAITCLQQGASVNEAAVKSGFHSNSYFSREFKKEMGVAPSRYKSE